jgi:hypothetical protein
VNNDLYVVSYYATLNLGCKEAGNEIRLLMKRQEERCFEKTESKDRRKKNGRWGGVSFEEFAELT